MPCLSWSPGRARHAVGLLPAQACKLVFGNGVYLVTVAIFIPQHLRTCFSGCMPDFWLMTVA